MGRQVAPPISEHRHACRKCGYPRCGSRKSLAVAKMVLANSSKANEYLDGSAPLANIQDTQAAGLLPARGPSGNTEAARGCRSTGVYVGAWLDKNGNLRYFRHNGPEHVLTYAPTRSGKGVGLVVPTLLSWGDSAVITDLKGELWALTSGWRQKHAKTR